MGLSRKKPGLTEIARQAGIYTAIPMVLAAGPTLGFLAGRFLDRRLSTDPWFLILGVLTGLIAGMVETVRLIEVAQQPPKDDSDRRRDNDGSRV